MAGAAIVATPTGTALACSCAQMSLAEFDAEFGDLIVAAFVGTQTDRVVVDEQSDDGAVLTFDVARVYAGEVASRFEVRTAAQSSACGLDVTGHPDVALLATSFRGRPNVGLCGSLFPESEFAAVFGTPSSPIESVAAPPRAGDGNGNDDENGNRNGNGTMWLVVSTVAAVALIGGAIGLSKRKTDGERPPAARQR